MPNVNDMTVFQAGTILQSLVKQATGQVTIAASTPGEFVSVAQTALKTGYDPILNAMSQMWGRTIFSIRPYNRKFSGLEMSMERWGNAVRKLSIADKPIEDDARFTWPVGYDSTKAPNALGEGESVDMYALNKPDILQVNFYGQSVYENSYTIFKDNMDVAFTSAEEFMRFNSLVTGNRSDKLEQYRENTARGILANYIGSLLAEKQTTRIVHLLSEYNTETGLTLTAQNVYQPENFAGFMQWAYARIATISRMMTERSEMYQTVINEKHVMRHTPANKQKVYLYAKAMDQFDAMVKSNTFHDNYLKFTDYEGVNFWQSIETPDSISVTPVYTNTTGTATTGEAVEQAGIFGVIFDEEALGYSQVSNWAAVTPFNAKGGYWNTYDHVNFRAIMDMSEKGVLLLLD